jgi:1,4-dihydroxy-2-naphthoate octaprenyltransferase
LVTKTPIHVHVWHIALMLACVCLLQLGAHLLNDYYDYTHGIDASNTFGPGGLIQQGLVNPLVILVMGLSMLGLGALGGLILAAAGGFLVYLFGCIGVLCAYFYSATSRALSTLGLSEVVAFLVFGPLMMLGAFLVANGVATQPGGYLGQVWAALHYIFVYSVSVGLLSAASIHLNNMRDIESDAQASKLTIAVWLGFKWSRAWFVVLILGAYASIVASVVDIAGIGCHFDWRLAQ